MAPSIRIVVGEIRVSSLSHLHWFRAQQSVGQQCPLKPRQGATLSAVQSWRWKIACNNYSKFFDLSAPSRAFNSGEKTRCTVWTFRLENWRTEERGLWVVLLCLSYNSHYFNYTADVSVKERKCKILIYAGKLSFVVVIDGNKMMLFIPPLPLSPLDHMLIKMWSIKEDMNGSDKQLMKEGSQAGQ